MTVNMLSRTLTAVIVLGLATLCASLPRVAFHAQMTKAVAPRKGDTVMFDKIDVNMGDGFKDGVFTAPTYGLYSISVTVTAAAKCFVTWYIESEGKVYAKVLADSVSHASDSATGNAVIPLKAGESVKIKHYENRCSVRCDVHICPTFSGFLFN